MPRQSLELVLDDTGDALVRDLWRRLLDAGLPSQAEHKSSSNAPHVTVLEADDIDPEVLDAAAALSMPVTLRCSGALWLGRSGQVLTLAVDLPDRDPYLDLRRRAGITSDWRTHLTLSRAIRGERRELALDALGDLPDTLTASALRHWDPRDRTLTTLAG